MDSNGNTVANYNGTINVAITANGAARLVGPSTTGYANGVSSLANVAVTNGVATFKVVGSSTGGLTDTVSANGLTGGSNATNINYGSVSVSTTTAIASQLAVSSALPSISVNSSANNANSTTVTVQVEDSAGNAFNGAEYVTLNLSGQGSFSPTSVVTSETVYTSSGTGQGTATVYGLVGQPGSITVTASASGLQSGTLTIPTYVNTTPANLTISSKSGTTSSGTAFTLYTVQLVDTNGHPITEGTNASDSVAISDNTATVGGTLRYYEVTNGQPNGTTQSMITTLTNGQLQFAVENTGVASVNPTITVKDTTENFTVTAPYSYQTGSPAQVAFTSTNSTGYVKAGQTVTLSAQLEDSNGNPLSVAGQNVVFYFDSSQGNSAGATLPNGVSLVGAANGYVATTNSQGVANIAITIPTAAGAGTTFKVDANLQNGSLSPATGAVETVEPAANYATSMAFGTISSGTFTAYGWPPNNTVTVGVNNSLTNVPVVLENAINGSVNTGDQLNVTTSNPSVLALSSYNSGSTNTQTITASSGAAQIPSITGEQAGTATITVTDLSNPNVPAISETLTVVAGAVAKGTIYVNGSPVSSTNPATVAANTPVAVTVVNTDAQGNPVPVTTGETNGATGESFALADPNGGQFRASPNGANITYATIPVGQTSTTVYYVNATAGSYSGMTASAPIGMSGVAVSPASTAPTVGITDNLTVSLTGASTFNGTLPISIGGAVVSPNGTAPTLPTTATFTNGSATVPIVLTSTQTQNITVTVEGWTSSQHAINPVADPIATVSSVVLDPSTGGPGLGYHTTAGFWLNGELANGTIVGHALQVTAVDQYGNPVTGSHNLAAATGFQIGTTDNSFTSTAAVTFNSGVGVVYVENASSGAPNDLAGAANSNGTLASGTTIATTATNALAVKTPSAVTTLYNVPSADVASISTTQSSGTVTLTLPANLATGYYVFTLAPYQGSGAGGPLTVTLHVTTTPTTSSTLAIDTLSTVSSNTIFTPGTSGVGTVSVTGTAFSIALAKGNIASLQYGFNSTSAPTPTLVGYFRANG